MKTLEELKARLEVINNTQRALAQEADDLRRQIETIKDPELEKFIGKYWQIGNPDEYFTIILVKKASRDRYSEDKEICLSGYGLRIGMEESGEIRSLSNEPYYTLYNYGPDSPLSGLRDQVIELSKEEFKATAEICLSKYKENFFKRCGV